MCYENDNTWNWNKKTWCFITFRVWNKSTYHSTHLNSIFLNCIHKTINLLKNSHPTYNVYYSQRSILQFKNPLLKRSRRAPCIFTGSRNIFLLHISQHDAKLKIFKSDSWRAPAAPYYGTRNFQIFNLANAFPFIDVISRFPGGKFSTLKSMELLLFVRDRPRRI